MKVLVISHAKNAQVDNSIANVVMAATKISNQCDVLILGNVSNINNANCSGVSKIFHLAKIENNLAVNLASTLAEFAKNYTHVLVSANSSGKDLLPRVAGILDVGQVSDVVAICSPNIFKKPMYAGNIIAEVESFDEIKLLTIRATSFAPASLGGNASIEVLNIEIKNVDNTKFIRENIVKTETIGLAQAKIIVSGGRSLGSAEDFNLLINGLAAKIGAGVGASRAAVEAGYVSNDCQVGQTGKIVAPQLYIAVGISGAVQHIAGMKDAKTVIAINSDSNAQIFEYADYGIVGDLFEVVPQLINQL